MVACSDQRLSRYGDKRTPSDQVDAGADADDADADVRPDASITIDGPTPWEWAENHDTILAPWVHQLDEQAAQGTTVEAERLVFDAAATPDALDYRRNDLVWATNESAEHSFLRRVVSVDEQGGQIVVETTNAQLDELFFKASLSQFALGDQGDSATEINVDEAFDSVDRRAFKYCRVDDAGPVDTCESFSEVDDNGDFTDGSQTGSALVFTTDFDVDARYRADRVAVELLVDFFEQSDSKCACAAQHYPDYQAIGAACGITSIEADVPEAVDDLKPQCRGAVKRLQVDLRGRSDLNIKNLALWASGPLSEQVELLHLDGGEAAAQIPSGFLNLRFSLENRVEFDVDDTIAVDWADEDSQLDFRLDSMLGFKWPRARGDSSPLASIYAVDVQRSLDDQSLGEVQIETDATSGARFVSQLVVETKLWGADGPTAIPLGVSAEVGAQVNSVDEPTECTLYQRTGSFVGLDFDRGFPLTFIDPDDALRSLEGCAQTDRGEIPGLQDGACTETLLESCALVNSTD